MAAKHRGLGRGLNALIKESPAADEQTPRQEGVTHVPIASIHKNPWQPRSTFAPDALDELVRSIREHGILQPLLVRKVEDHHQLIAGERRYRAAQVAELTEIPVIIMEVSDREALELALIENLQREDLNLIEEAEGYRALMDKFDMTQERVAERVGKARATVANALRLLHLPDNVKTWIAEGALSAGHAKALLGLEIPLEQELLAARAMHEGLSVRAVEAAVGDTKKAPKKKRAEKKDLPDEYLRDISERLQQALGTGVRITPSKTLANGKKVKGRIDIDYYSNDDLDRLLSLLGITDSF